MPADGRIDYLEIPSADMPALSRFFAAAFGWPPIEYGPAYRGVGGAGIDMGLDGSAERVEGLMLVIRTSDLAAAEAAVVAAGGTILREAYDFPGGRRFHFRAPGGPEMAVYVER